MSTNEKKNSIHFKITGAPEQLKVVPLGGCGGFSLHCTCFETKEDMIVVDCGLMLPDHEQPGVDIIFPDLTYLSVNRDKIRGYFLTHGHDDHIGAIPFALQIAPAPVYGTDFTLGMLKNRLDDHIVPVEAILNIITPGDQIDLGDSFVVEPITVAHSIPGSVAYSMDTPSGKVLITGDYKMKGTDQGCDKSTDIDRLEELGEEGVELLLGDSTNALVPGAAGTEDDLHDFLAQTFATSPGRIFVSLFSTHVPRIQTICDICKRFNRKIFFDGRSLQTVVKLARRLEILDIPEHLLMPTHLADGVPRKNSAVLLTGSQGEPRSALARLAMDANNQMRLEPGDTVILSARVIPGRERSVDRMVDRLYRLGAVVIDNRFGEKVHVSGHGQKEDLKKMIQILRPRNFLPIHGRYRMQMENGEIARRLGTDHVLIPNNGTVIGLGPSGLCELGQAPVGQVLVDGNSVGDVEIPVLRARKALAHMGMVVAVALLDVEKKELARPLELISRGFIMECNKDDLFDSARKAVERDIHELAPNARSDASEVAETLRLGIRRFFRKELNRAPVVIPLVIET